MKNNPFGKDLPGLIQQTWILLKKDALVELRSKESMPLMIVFCIVSLVIFNFTFDLRASNVDLLAPGILWVSFIFSGLLGLGRSFTRETERETLAGIRLAPVDPEAIYLSKMFACFLSVTILQLLLTFLMVVFFGVDLAKPYILIVLPLGSLGFAAIGTPFAAMTMSTRAREALLPVLLLPILLPLILAVVSSTALAMDGVQWNEISRWIHFLIGYDILFLTISFLGFQIIVEE